MHASDTASTIRYRPLTTRPDCEAVVALEREIWGPRYDEAVPVALLLVTQARGGILIGAFDQADRMVGFVYSLSAVKDGRPTQWSYKLGVIEAFRNDGVGEQLKLRQRQRALELGLDLIEWTFDPMLAANAHLNLTKLGAVVREYHEDLYGRSLTPLMYRGIPTDRAVAAWHIRHDTVPRRETPALDRVPPANAARVRGEWLECGSVALDLDAPWLSIEIPRGYSAMVARAPDLALAWRLVVRRLFTAYLAKGYGAVEFQFDRAHQTGRYLLARMVSDMPTDASRIHVHGQSRSHLNGHDADNVQ